MEAVAVVSIEIWSLEDFDRLSYEAGKITLLPREQFCVLKLGLVSRFSPNVLLDGREIPLSAGCRPLVFLETNVQSSAGFTDVRFSALPSLQALRDSVFWFLHSLPDLRHAAESCEDVMFS